MTISTALSAAEAERLAAHVAELERECKHLLAVIEILKEVSTSLHFIDILQGIARKLGETFGLDRCSIFLAERGGKSVRLVASYEDPTIRNYVVDLERYPELKRAMQTGETVFIPDAANDPSLKHVKGELINRRVKSITVVPITWRSAAIGSIFLRTFRDGPTFSDEDVGFVQVVASLTAQALRNAHRYERLAQRHQETDETMRCMELERVALLAFLRRLLGAFGEREGPWAEGLLPHAEGAEQAPQEREQRHALELHTPHRLVAVPVALGEALVAVGVAERLRREGGDDLHEAHVLVGKRGAVAERAQEDRADGGRAPRDRDDGDRLHAAVDQLPLHVLQARVVRRVRNEDRLAGLHGALQLRVALEIDDVVADGGVLVRGDQAHRFAAALGEEDRAAVEPEGLAQLARDPLQDVDEMQRGGDFFQDLDHGEEVLALALQLRHVRGETLRFGGREG